MKKPIVPSDFELTNLHRRYLGLGEVEPTWDKVCVKNSCWILYFDGDVIRKIAARSESHYYESDVCEHTTDNRTVVLPKTKRGKPKKLNFTAIQSFGNKGIYFSFSDDYITLANYTTQTTFYQARNKAHISIDDWLRQWVEESTEKDLEEIQAFSSAKRRHQKYAEGDFFAFKIGRHKWGFGRIVLDVAKRCKSEEFREDNPGLDHLMGQALMIMIYRHLSDSPETDLDKLHTYGTLPVQAIMDNHFYYGEYTVIGNRPVSPEEWEPVISLERTYERPDDWDISTYLDRRAETSGTAYLQYGLICARTDVEKIRKFLIPGAQGDGPVYQNGAIGFNINHYEDLERIISDGIANDSLLLSNENRKDLRKRENHEAKSGIFRLLGLDPDASYAENLRIFQR